MKFEIYEGVRVRRWRRCRLVWCHEWYWRLKARNGKIVGAGAEGYFSKANAVRAAENVRENMRSPLDHRRHWTPIEVLE